MAHNTKLPQVTAVEMTNAMPCCRLRFIGFIKKNNTICPFIPAGLKT